MKMENKTKFKLITFFKYILIEPWVTKFSLPNFKTIIWGFIFFSLLLRRMWLIWTSVSIGIIYWLFSEYKSGKFIYWYRERKMKSYRDAKKRVREEKKKRIIPFKEEINEMGEN